MQPITDVRLLEARDQLLLFAVREHREHGVSDLLLAALRALHGMATLEHAVVALEAMVDALHAGRRRALRIASASSEWLRSDERVLLALLDAERRRDDDLATRLATWLVRAADVPMVRLHAARLAAESARPPRTTPGHAHDTCPAYRAIP